MGVKDQFLNYAADFAEQAHQRVAELDRKLATLKAQRAIIEAQRDSARHALQRLANYPVVNGSDYLCPKCWVTKGAMTPMTPMRSIPNETHHDLFSCPLCHINLEIEP